MPAEKKRRLIAKLDPQGHLVGTRRAVPTEGDLVLPESCDLPADGSYRWDGATFHPLGHGHPTAVPRPPCSEARVLWMLVTAFGDKLPKEARDWAAWYGENLKTREAEVARAVRRRLGSDRRGG